MLKVGDSLFRAEVFGEHVVYDEFRIERVTPCGYWIRGRSGDFLHAKERWIIDGSRFASATKEIALVRCKARKRAFVRHSRRRLRQAEADCAALGIPVPSDPLLTRGFYE